MKKPYNDQEVIGREPSGTLIFWNAEKREPYTSGESLKQYGINNLTTEERYRIIPALKPLNKLLRKVQRLHKDESVRLDEYKKLNGTEHHYLDGKIQTYCDVIVHINEEIQTVIKEALS